MICNIKWKGAPDCSDFFAATIFLFHHVDDMAAFLFPRAPLVRRQLAIDLLGNRNASSGHGKKDACSFPQDILVSFRTKSAKDDFTRMYGD